MEKRFGSQKAFFATLVAMLFAVSPAFAGEASLVVPNIRLISPSSYHLLLAGIVVSICGLIFGYVEFLKVRKVRVHESMADIGSLIFETCKTYLIQQGKFLLALEVLIGACIAFYFGVLQKMGVPGVLAILGCCLIHLKNSSTCQRFL